MAIDSPPMIWKQRKTAFAIETTTGSKATLAATDAVTRCYDTEIAADWDKVDRPVNDMQPAGTRHGQRRARVTLGHEVYGGTTAPHWTRLLRGAGYSDTAVAKKFIPTFPSITTLSFGTYRPGEFLAAIGCVGTGVLKIEDAKPWRFDWTYTGMFDVPDGSTAVSGITYEDVPPLQGVGVLSVGSGPSLVVPSLEIDLGNQVQIRGDVQGVDSAGNKTGGRSGYITDFLPMARITSEAVSLAVRDWYAIHRNYGEVALSITGGSGNNYLSITAPRLRLDDVPTPTNNNGMAQRQLNFMCLGDDANPALAFDFNAPA